MNDLEMEERALLDLARDGHEPSAADRQRVRRMLAASLGAAAGLATTTTVGTSVAAATGAASVATKMVVVAVIAAAAGAGGAAAYLQRRGETGAPTATAAGRVRQPPPLAKPRPLPRAAAPAVAASPAPALPARDEQPILEASPARAARPVPRPGLQERAPLAVPRPPAVALAPAAFEPAGPPASLETPVPTTIEAETRLLRDGLAALHSGDPARALALFDEHARRYASGVLAEERSAERVVALHDLGRVIEANQAAAAFLRDHPSSPLRARVRAACPPAPNR